MTTQLEQAARQALEALDDRASLMKWQAAREALRAALEQPAQDEPFGHVTVRRLSQRFENHVDQYYFYPAGQSPYLDNVDECHAVYTRPQAREPVALNREYAQRLIEALHENGDPVSVDAAEEFERLLTSPQAREPLTTGQILEIGMQMFGDSKTPGSDPTIKQFSKIARAIEAAHSIGEKK